MRAFVINGSRNGAEFTYRLEQCLERTLRARGWDSEILDVAASKVAPCRACGSCAWKTPGVCGQRDDGQVVVRATAECDLIVLVSAITFGGYSSCAKRALERTLPNVHPLFLKYRGELHHRYRYARSPSLLVIGWQAHDNPGAGHVFSKLAERNAMNFMAPWFESLVISGEPEPEDLKRRLSAVLDGWGRTSWQPTPNLSPEPAEAGLANPGGPVLLVVASGHKRSNTRAIGEHLANRLFEEGQDVNVFDVAAAGGPERSLPSLLEAMRQTERAILLSPLYHDTLSFAAISLLEQLAQHRHELPPSLAFGAFVHSGYPEPVHTQSALAVCREFARAMEFGWLGGLSAGATSPIAGEDLEKAGFIAKNLRRALDRAAVELAQGQGFSAELIRMAARPPLWPILFKLAANFVQRRGAKRAGAKDLDARPYAKNPSLGVPARA